MWRFPCVASVSVFLLLLLCVESESYLQVEAVDKLSRAEMEDIYRYGRPVVVRNWLRGVCPECFELWDVDTLLRSYPNDFARFGTSSQILNNHGNGVQVSSLQDWMDHSATPISEPSYIFDRNEFLQSHPELTEKIEHVEFYSTSPNASFDSYFLLGAPNSGVSFHRHADGWNMLFTGRKKWFFYPPSCPPVAEHLSVYLGHPKWISRVHDTGNADQCPDYLEIIQQAGDWI